MRTTGVRPFEPTTDLNAVTDLLRALWTDDPEMNERVLDWKYRQNPSRAWSRIFVVEDAGRPVGVRGFYGATWCEHSLAPVVPGPVAGDTVIARAHRGRGWFERLNRAAIDALREAGAPFVCNLSGAPVVHLRSRRRGWEWVGPYRPLVRRPSEPAGAGFQVLVEDTPRPEAMAALWTSEARTGGIGQRRDAEWIRWRYANPLSRYTFVIAPRAGDPGGALAGYLVLQDRLFKERPGGLRIVDVEAVDPDTFETLVRRATAVRPDRSLTIWSAGLDTTRLHSLSTLGFEPLDDTRGRPSYRPGPLIRPLAETPAFSSSDLRVWDDWRPRMIDSDSH